MGRFLEAVALWEAVFQAKVSLSARSRRRPCVGLRRLCRPAGSPDPAAQLRQLPSSARVRTHVNKHAGHMASFSVLFPQSAPPSELGAQIRALRVVCGVLLGHTHVRPASLAVALIQLGAPATHCGGGPKVGKAGKGERQGQFKGHHMSHHTWAPARPDAQTEDREYRVQSPEREGANTSLRPPPQLRRRSSCWEPSLVVGERELRLGPVWRKHASPSAGPPLPS
jgi:hypothetical protein